jgi:PAS domain S-box-containing protein
MTDKPSFAFFALDANGFVRSWNDRAERMKGYQADEIMDRHVSIFYPEDRVAFEDPEAELERSAKLGCYIGEGWRVRKDGSRFWAHFSITAERNTNGCLTGFIQCTLDLSSYNENTVL